MDWRVGLACPEGLEPPTPSLEGIYSLERHETIWDKLFEFSPLFSYSYKTFKLFIDFHTVPLEFIICLPLGLPLRLSLELSQ
jgi:hypothetical protein